MTAPLPGTFQFFQPAHHAQLVFVARPRYHDKLDDVLKPAYWAHNARDLRPGTLIRVMPEGLEWYAELIVIDADAVSAKVKLLPNSYGSLVDTPVRKDAASDFKAEPNGKSWRVIRKVDGQVVQSGLHGEAEALAWILKNTSVEA